MNDPVSREIKKGIDLRRHIAITQRDYPQATGEFSQLLGQIALAGKIVSREVNRAGLGDILGKSKEENIHGERQARLDLYANAVFTRALIHNGGICIIGSEEESDPIAVRQPELRGKYVITIDPLDGSSNIDYNASIGTIFGIYRKISSPGTEKSANLADLLQPGRDLVAAGYIIYGASTVMVYTTGQHVYGFTLDNSIGEFLLSYPNIKIPENEGYLSFNESYFSNWDKPVQQAVKEFRESGLYSSRYIGTMVADFHRNLLAGGIFMYPAERDVPGKRQGKLRLLYEAAPVSFIIENAGGAGSDGFERIVNKQPENLHDKTPLFAGSKKLVGRVEELYRDWSEDS